MTEESSKSNTTLVAYVDARLLFTVKLKANGEISGMSTSGVLDWLMRKYLNPEAQT